MLFVTLPGPRDHGKFQVCTSGSVQPTIATKASRSGIGAPSFRVNCLFVRLKRSVVVHLKERYDSMI